MLRTVHLYGRLKNEFGAKHRFDVATASEALRALNCAFPGRFVRVLRQGSYEITRGRGPDAMPLDLDLVCRFNLGEADLHVIPVAAGSSDKGRGTIKAITGVALVGAAIFLSGGTLAAPLASLGNTIAGTSLTYGNVALLGLGVALSGVSTMLAKPANTPADHANDASFTFSGPVNVNEQGAAVPLIYGEVITGGQPISAGFDVEDIGAYAGQDPVNILATALQNRLFGS